MATNGGTLNGVPQQPQRGQNNSCNTCGMTFDSAESLQVHVHYHHTENSLNRWGHTMELSVTSNASNSPTDSENNNQPKQYNIHQPKTISSPINNTISAAADSSDNQPSTPQPSVNDQCQPIRSTAQISNNPPFENQTHLQNQQLQQQANEMHYSSYMHGSYDQYYHHHAIEYGIPPPPPHFLGNPITSSPPQLHQEYKSVPSTRFQPYGHHLNSSSLVPTHHPYHQSQIPLAVSSEISTQNALGPHVVTSTSPVQFNSMHSTTVPSSTTSNANACLSTSSPALRQCSKCGLVCDTIIQLNEHHSTVHGSAPAAGTDPNDLSNIQNSGNGDNEIEIPSYQFTSYASRNLKEEPECDILDLDSQKMIYPPQDVTLQQGPLPSMQSLHPIQRSMMWPHVSCHDFVSIRNSSNSNQAQEIKSVLYGPIKNEFTPQIIKQEVVGSASHHLAPVPSNQQKTPSNGSKVYANDRPANQIATSPSEFPSTTTPQENGSQFRTFEAASSSLPNSATVIKATSWKSNEARRPKTYNCTACNKWFTSSGHLKRHYNTTLHKNAVKSSGQPDPATLPISVHHHPARDPNSKHNHRHNSNANVMTQQQLPLQQQSIIMTDSTRTQEFQPQYTSPSMGFQQSQHSITAGSFPQYANQTQIQSNVMIPPNAQAGLSVLAFQPRGLLNYSNIRGMQTQDQPIMSPQLQAAHHHQSERDFIQVAEPLLSQKSTITTNSMEATVQACNRLTPITISTNITQLYQDIQQPQGHQQTLHTIIGNNNATDTVMIQSITDIQENLNLQDEDTNVHSTVLLDYGNGSISTTSTKNVNEQKPYSMKKGYLTDAYQNYDDLNESCENRMLVATTKIPMISAIRSSNGNVYHADTVPPFSPNVPDKKVLAPYHKFYQDRSSTPQTGEVVPAHLSPSGPTSHQYTGMSMSSNTSMTNEPGSPRVTSTNTASGTVSIHKSLKGRLKAKSCGETTKRRVKRGNGVIATKSVVGIFQPINGTLSSNDGAIEDPLRCVPCDKVFNKACYLTQHNKTFHSGEKPYKCRRCGKRFPCDQSHDEHLAKHIGNKPFKCNQCTKQFNHKTDLRRHMCLHTGTKPYSCSICNKGFIRKDHMVKHGLTHLKRKQNDSHSNHSSQIPEAKSYIKITNKRNVVHSSNKKRKITEL